MRVGRLSFGGKEHGHADRYVPRSSRYELTTPSLAVQLGEEEQPLMRTTPPRSGFQAASVRDRSGAEP
jgi:hypothetical protein